MKKRRYYNNWFWVVLGTIMLAYGCSSDDQQLKIIPQSSKADTLQNEYAKTFRIIYQGEYVKIDILNPDDQEVIEEYRIMNQPETYNDFPREINSVITTSSTQIGVMNALHLQSSIVGIPETKYLCHPMDESRVKAVGDIFRANAETYASVQPDIILYSGYDMSAPILDKFKQANLKSFLVYEWKENHPLGRAEWLKVYGVLFNKEKEAKALFKDIQTKYLKLKEQFAKADKSQKVLVGTYFGEIFNAPAGESYMANFFKDANVDYVYANTKGTGSLELTLEEMITKNKDVPYWLNMASITKGDLYKLNEKFKLLRSFKEGNLYSYFKNNNCFWENAIVEPYAILEDLGKIFHPQLFENHQLNYYSLVE